jgi:hypothetical protein
VKSEANPVDGDATPTRVREPDERSAKTRTRIRATQPPRERRKQEAGTVEISLESTPSNAHVHLDGVHIGETPLTHRLDRGEAKHRLRFSRFGYRTESVTLVPSADRDVRVRLERKRLQLGP